ncbi:unnamed protein product [Tuber aestivum]|uniref:Uncharacterized protein n=1 Tax=Tuber aestivum TaxID=59557 RepID=A0A292PII8_9PEZI|nr:unnamed protein product [Tuber aestivum]
MPSFSNHHSLTISLFRLSVYHFRTPAASCLKILKTQLKQGSCEVQPKIQQRYFSMGQLRTKEVVINQSIGYYYHEARVKANLRFHEFVTNQQELCNHKTNRLVDLHVMILKKRIERMKTEKKSDLRGVLELLVYCAYYRDQLREFNGMQDSLIQLGAKPDFFYYLEKEALARTLAPIDVAPSIFTLYQAVQKRRYPTSMIVFIRTRDFSFHERAALVAFMRLQDEWLKAVEWHEVRVVREGAGWEQLEILADSNTRFGEEPTELFIKY